MNNDERKEELEKQRQDEEMYMIEMAAAAALPAWIQVVSANLHEHGYSYEAAAEEAVRLSIITGDRLIAATKEYKSVFIKSQNNPHTGSIGG